MGAEVFTHGSELEDVREAFRECVDEALYDYGHSGYSGTIAEKGDFVVIDSTPHSKKDATNLAWRLIDERDPRIDDKWGPAGAIKLEKGWLFFGWASS